MSIFINNALRQRPGGGGGVRVPPAERSSQSLSSMLLELATMCLYGDPERHAAIVTHCVMDVDAVPLTAPHAYSCCMWIELRAD